jgi:PAS domain S-box-containing protein
MFLTFFLLLLTLSLFVTVGFALYALRHWQTPGARPFALILLGYGLYTVWYACELLAPSLAAKVAWDNAQFTATDIIIIGYLWFALEYTRRAAAIRWVLPWCGGILALNALLVWTNPAHHLVRSASALLAQGNVTILTYTYGPWFWAYIAYLVLGVLAAVGVLFMSFVRAPRFYQWQVGAIIIGMLTPMVSGLVTVSSLMPFPELAHLDVNPLAYLVTMPFWGWALFHQRFLDLVPIARSHLVEAMPDGVLVIDAQGRIVDCNASAHAVLPDLRAAGIGTPATTVLPEFAAVLIAEPSRTHARPPSTETASGIVQPWLDIRSTPLHDAREHLAGWLVTLRDQTEYWQMEQSLRDQNARLEYEILERQHAEEAYRNLVQFSLQGLMILQEGRVVFANAAIEMIHGYTIDELQAMSAEDLMLLIHPDDRAEVQQRMQLYVDDGVFAYRHEHRIVNKQGQTRWVEVYVAQVDFRGNLAFQLTFLDITERRQAEEALRESEQFVQQITTTIPDILYIYDLRLQQNIYSNSQMTAILGYTPEEVQTMGPDVMPMLVHPDDLPRVIEHLSEMAERHASDKSVNIVEYRMHHRDGRWRWLLSREVPFSNTPDGRVGQLLGVAHDITERKQAEAALRETKARFAAFMDYLPGPAFIHDQHGRVMFANRIYCQHLNKPAEEVIGQPYRTLLPPEKAAYFQAQDHEVLTMQQACVFEDRADIGDQTTIFLTTKFAMQQADGSTHIGGVAVDITERKQAEDALRESEKRLQAIFDNAAVGIGLTDNAGKSIISNARGAQQLGYTPEELEQVSNMELTHPDDRAETTEHMRQLLRGEIQGYRIEKRYCRKDGSIFWADLSVSAVYDDDGQIDYLLGIVADITERKQAEEALRASKQFIQDIAATIPGILYVYDLTLHRNVYSNRQIWEVLGYTSEEFQAMDSNAIPNLLHPDDMQQVVRHIMLHEEAEEGTVLSHEYRMRHRDGDWRWLLSHEVTFVRNADGQPMQVLGIAQDITG